MVKFLKRNLSRPYKGKEHDYVKFSLELPTRLNAKIAPHANKVFDQADITSKETSTQEILNISLVRNKTPQDLDDIEKQGDS